MKKNLVVLVLLVMWSLLSVFSFSSVAYADPTGDSIDMGSIGNTSKDGLVVEVYGAGDDDKGGDPGDAGDGYGITDSDGVGALNGTGFGPGSILDEYLLILTSLVQLAL